MCSPRRDPPSRGPGCPIRTPSDPLAGQLPEAFRRLAASFLGHDRHRHPPRAFLLLTCTLADRAPLCRPAPCPLSLTPTGSRRPTPLRTLPLVRCSPPRREAALLNGRPPANEGRRSASERSEWFPVNKYG